MLNVTRITTLRRRRDLIAVYGDYLGGKLHSTITGRIASDMKLGIAPKAYYSFQIAGTEQSCWLLVW